MQILTQAALFSTPMLNPVGTADPKQQVTPAKANVMVHPPGT